MPFLALLDDLHASLAKISTTVPTHAAGAARWSVRITACALPRYKTPYKTWAGARVLCAALRQCPAAQRAWVVPATLNSAFACLEPP